ncbi:YciI family protein [Pelagibacterium halotolerans]|uniref:YciI family protein n=1 Tax=Pelagibacterium halotolerans TaxID=531813 RepID=UPI00384E4DC5
MRFMVMIKASAETEAGVMPTDEQLLAMGKYNEELVAAGVMKDGAGLHPTSRGARIVMKDGETIVTDGPFAETKEVIAGFWIWECASLAEAIEWLKKVPESPGQADYEIRQIFEMEDFVQGEGIEQHKKVAQQMEEQGLESQTAYRK